MSGTRPPNTSHNHRIHLLPTFMAALKVEISFQKPMGKCEKKKKKKRIKRNRKNYINNSVRVSF